MKTDLSGREYAQLSELRAGMIVQVDGDFDCIEAWSTREIKHDPDAVQSLYVDCKCGRHCLEAQIDCDDGDSLIGIYPAPEPINLHFSDGSRFK